MALTNGHSQHPSHSRVQQAAAANGSNGTAALASAWDAAAGEAWNSAVSWQGAGSAAEGSAWDQYAAWHWDHSGGAGDGQWFDNSSWDCWPDANWGSDAWWGYGGAVATPGEQLAAAAGCIAGSSLGAGGGKACSSRNGTGRGGGCGGAGGYVSSAALAAEYQRTARVHFGKTYQVLSEIIEQHPHLFQGAQSFLDLGCAPGGFSSRLLQDLPSTARGFGVTLPTQAGGFPILVDDARLQVQASDLMSLASPDALECADHVDVCMADAQDLGRRTSGSARRADRKGGGRGKGAPARPQEPAEVLDGGGVGAACTVLGIWALTLQEFLLGFGRLKDGGVFVFRFGWRGKGVGEEPWYREATHLLFGLVFAHFQEVAHFKSEFSHQADASFYVVASGFHGERYAEGGLGERLREVVDDIVRCTRPVDLPRCMESLAPFATPESRSRIDELLEAVGRLRQIGMASRHRVEDTGRSSPEAAIWISPVPYALTMQRIRERLERYGKIAYIKRRAHPIGVGADALVQFVQVAHATAALEAITELKALGDNISAKRLSDAQGTA